MKPFWRTPWGLAALLLCGAAFIFVLVVLLLPIPGVLGFFRYQPDTKFDRSRGSWEKSAPLWVTIAPNLTIGTIGIFGTLIALWQFQRTHSQKEEQFADNGFRRRNFGRFTVL